MTAKLPKVEIAEPPEQGLSVPLTRRKTDLFDSRRPIELAGEAQLQFHSLTKIAAIAIISALLVSYGTSVVLAQPSAPLKQTLSSSIPPRLPSQNQYSLFMPMAQRSSMTAPSAAPVAKKGIGLPYHDCDSVSKVGASWQYGWTPQPDNCAGVENVPMVYGLSDMTDPIGGNSQWLMGFNEPDSPSQSNLAPSQAATLWRQIEQSNPNRKLVSPAPTATNVTWIIAFRNAYISMYGAPPRFDALAIHCYAWSASECISYAQQYEAWAKSWGVPEVWVTEFSISPVAPNNPTRAIQEGQKFMNWMASDPMITHFAWFVSKMQGTEAWAPASFDTPTLDWSSGSLTSYGQMYLPYR